MSKEKGGRGEEKQRREKEPVKKQKRKKTGEGKNRVKRRVMFQDASSA